MNIKILKKTLKFLKNRSLESHKYNFGSLLVLGGNYKYSGSPALAALSAYRAGVDIVEIAAPERVANIVAGFSPDLITIPLKGEFFREKHIQKILEALKNKTTFLLGGGLGRERETKKAVLKLLEKINLPCVIDADAIYAFSGNLKKIKRNFVFLPHSYEFFVLTGKEIFNLSLKERIFLVRREAKKLQCVLVVKGNPDIIANEKEVFLNYTGNPYMTVGGTGDTLAGIISSLIAQRIDPFTAACLGAYLNGKAGDLVAKEKKQGLLATDIIEKIPYVF